MAIDNKNQVNRTRDDKDTPSGFDRKPMLDEKKAKGGLRGEDKQGVQKPDVPPDSDTQGGIGSQGGM